MTPAVVLQVGVASLTTGISRVVGMALLAAGLAAAVAVTYRWYAGTRVQEGLAALVGLAGVAVYLNTTTALGQVITPSGPGTGLFDLEAALVNVATFLLAGLATMGGRVVGDRLAVEASALTGRRPLQADVGRLVEAVGRVVTVTLPDDIDDIEGYDPVEPETKAALAGTTLLFPRRLTVAELHARLRERLADDHGIGHVDVELADDGTVEYLAVGRAAAGLGPTLEPGSAAVAVRADPAFSASPGDAVELWTGGEEPERVATGGLRAAAGEVVTLVVDEAVARDLDSAAPYRLVTRPTTRRADREFAALLRVADETMAAVTVEADSPLAGATLGDADVVVVAVQPADGDLVAVPSRSREVAVGDIIYAIGTPEALRGLEAGASAPQPEPSS